MPELNNEITNDLKAWYKLNLEVLKSPNIREQISKVLTRNFEQELNPHLACSIDSICINMSEFTGMKFDISNESGLFHGILTIVLKASTLSLKTICSSSNTKSSCTTYCNFLKLFMKLLKVNPELVIHSREIIEEVTTYMSDQFFIVVLKSNENSEELYSKIAHIQLKVIAELQKMCPNNSHGTSAMLKTIMDLATRSLDGRSALLISQFRELLWNLQQSADFYASFFEVGPQLSDAQLNIFFRLCLEVAENVSKNSLQSSIALSTDEESNFCLLLIKSMALNPQLLHLNPEVFDQLILKSVQLLDNKLPDSSFHFIEKKLIKGMLSKDFWLSIICTIIVSEYLVRLASFKAALGYFQFFHKVAMNLLTEPDDFTLAHVSNVMKLILKVHPKTADSEPKLDKFLFEVPLNPMELTSVIRGFTQAFQQTVNQPNVKNYSDMLNNLRLMARTGKDSQSTKETFTELLELTTRCDWTLHSKLIVAIMTYISSSLEDDIKMAYFHKFYLAKNNAEVLPLTIKLVLIDMLFSFLSIAKHNGLKGILIRELNKLLGDKDPIINKAVVRKFAASNDPIVLELTKHFDFRHELLENTEDEKLNIIKKSKSFRRIHKCGLANYEAEHGSPTDRQLQFMLKHSKSVQNRQLPGNEREVIQQIASNYNKVLQAPHATRPSNGF